LQGPTGPIVSNGNVAIVDALYGNDATASVGGSPYSTVTAAVGAVVAGQTVWVLPGTYTLPSGLALRPGTSLRGMSLQTCTITMDASSNASQPSVTMLTMAENCRVEDLTLNLNYSGTGTNYSITGIVFGGTTSQTAKLRQCVLNVTNTSSTSLSATVTGINFSGTQLATSDTFGFNSVKGSTINVYSNGPTGSGSGSIRGILVSGQNQVSTRDTNIYVAQPTNTTSTGSYVGVETKDNTNIGSIQLRSTTVGVVYPSGTQSYTASDILQTNPTTIINPTYLASAGIQIGPGTDLVTKSAGGRGFSTFVYPTIIYYGLRGSITSSGSGGYLWPGTQSISAGTFPDTGIPPAYFRVQQPALISGMSASLNTAPTNSGNSLTVSVYIQPINNSTTTIFTGSINGTALSVTNISFGTIAVGQTIYGVGITQGTTILSGSGLSWVVSQSNSVLSITITSNTPLSSTASIFVGTIANTTLTVTASSPIYGTIAVGQALSGTGVALNTYIVSGSGSSWGVYPSQTISSPTTITGTSPNSTLSGYISNGTSGSAGTILTVTTPPTPATGFNVGQYLTSTTAVAPGTYIVNQLTPTTWTVSSSQIVGTSGVPANFNSTGLVSTPFTLTFQATDTQLSFYNASYRLNTGDKIVTYCSYISGSGGNQSHDLTVQIDLF
jgi:hypothetical protein